MNSERRKALWQAAFGQLKIWTQAIQALPSKPVILNRALRAVRSVSHTNPIERWLARAIALEIADYIIDNWDASARRQHKSSQKDRAARNKEIVAASQGGSRSARALSDAIAMSPSQISRILRASGIAPQQDKRRAGLTSDGLAALKFIEGYVPPNSVRAIRNQDLVSYLTYRSEFRDPQEADAIARNTLNGLEAAKLSISFFYINGTVVIARGRSLDEQKGSAWLSRARWSSHIQLRRLPHDHGSRVWKDLLAVEVVIRQQARADDWRDFVEITCMSSSQIGSLEYLFASRVGELAEQELDALRRLETSDQTAIVRTIAKGQRKRDQEDVISSIRVWNRPYEAHYVALETMLDLVENLDGYETLAAIEIWMAETYYRERVSAGIVSDRDIDHIDAFLEAVRESERHNSELGSELNLQADRLCLIAYYSRSQVRLGDEAHWSTTGPSRDVHRLPIHALHKLVVTGKQVSSQLCHQPSRS